MSSKLAKIVADFRTTLATEIAIGGTDATLQSYLDDDGVALPTGTYFFALDGDGSAKEHIVCTLTAGVLSAIKSVSRQGVQTVGVARKHRIGASVVITDFAHIMYMNDLLSGTTDLNAAVPLKYDADPTLTLDAQLATVKFVNDTAIAGGAIGSHTTPGIYLKATTTETIAGTDTNGTYTYVIPVGLTKATTAGAADSGKIPLLNTSGVLASAFVDYVRTWTNIQTFSASTLQITSDASSGNDPVRKTYLDTRLSTAQDAQPYGDGSDGAITFDGSTTYAAFASLSGGVYTLTRNVYATTIVLSGTAIVDCANAEVYATVSITRTGTAKFRNNGNAGTAGASGGAGAAAKAGITLPGQVASGGGASGSNNNAQGGTGTAGTAVTFGIVGAGAGGGAGGAGSGGGPGPGGGAGAAPATKRLPRTVSLATLFFDYITGTLQLIQTSSGSGGGGGGWGTGTSGSTGGTGGGGGGPAGIVKVSALTITDSGTGTMFEAIGGVGGAGSIAAGTSIASGGGGGGGGNGGVIIRIYHNLTGTAATNVTAGAGGVGGAGVVGGGTGVTGSTGTAGAVYNIIV